MKTLREVRWLSKMIGPGKRPLQNKTLSHSPKHQLQLTQPPKLQTPEDAAKKREAEMKARAEKLKRVRTTQRIKRRKAKRK